MGTFDQYISEGADIFRMEASPRFLFFLQNGSGDFFGFASERGVFTSAEPQPLEGIKKEDLKIKLRRNREDYAVNVSYFDSLTFYGDAFRVIEYVFITDTDSAPSLTILERDSTRYRVFFQGVLKMDTLRFEKGNSCTCVVIASPAYEHLSNSQDTDVTLSAREWRKEKIPITEIVETNEISAKIWDGNIYERGSGSKGASDLKLKIPTDAVQLNVRTTHVVGGTVATFTGTTKITGAQLTLHENINNRAGKAFATFNMNKVQARTHLQNTGALTAQEIDTALNFQDSFFVASQDSQRTIERLQRPTLYRKDLTYTYALALGTKKVEMPALGAYEAYINPEYSLDSQEQDTDGSYSFDTREDDPQAYDANPNLVARLTGIRIREAYLIKGQVLSFAFATEPLTGTGALTLRFLAAWDGTFSLQFTSGTNAVFTRDFYPLEDLLASTLRLIFDNSPYPLTYHIDTTRMPQGRGRRFLVTSNPILRLAEKPIFQVNYKSLKRVFLLCYGVGFQHTYDIATNILTITLKPVAEFFDATNIIGIGELIEMQIERDERSSTALKIGFATTQIDKFQQNNELSVVRKYASKARGDKREVDFTSGFFAGVLGIDSVIRKGWADEKKGIPTSSEERTGEIFIIEADTAASLQATRFKVRGTLIPDDILKNAGLAAPVIYDTLKPLIDSYFYFAGDLFLSEDKGTIIEGDVQIRDEVTGAEYAMDAPLRVEKSGALFLPLALRGRAQLTKNEREQIRKNPYALLKTYYTDAYHNRYEVEGFIQELSMDIVTGMSEFTLLLRRMPVRMPAGLY